MGSAEWSGGIIGKYKYFAKKSTITLSTINLTSHHYAGEFLSDEDFALLQRIFYCDEVQFLCGLQVGDVASDSGLDVDGRPHVGENDGALDVGNIGQRYCGSASDGRHCFNVDLEEELLIIIRCQCLTDWLTRSEVLRGSMLMSSSPSSASWSNRSSAPTIALKKVTLRVTTKILGQNKTKQKKIWKEKIRKILQY